MVVVRDVKEFVEKNQKELINFFVYKTKIYDAEVINEHMQEFYVRLIKTRALQEYREDKGAFNTYIFNLLCWLLPGMARNHARIHHAFISNVIDNNESSDVWDHVSDFNGPFKMAEIPESVCERPDDLLGYYISEFSGYIKRTESENSARQMVTFIEHKVLGLKSRDIAFVMGTTDANVMVIKQKLKRKFELWKRMI